MDLFSNITYPAGHIYPYFRYRCLQDVHSEKNIKESANRDFTGLGAGFAASSLSVCTYIVLKPGGRI